MTFQNAVFGKDSGNYFICMCAYLIHQFVCIEAQ